MIKSASFRNFVLLMVDMFCERIRSWYGMSVWSGRRTWLEIVLTRWKKSSAVLNRSATVGTSSVQYPSHLPRHSSESRSVQSAAEHIPDHACDAYSVSEKRLWHEICHAVTRSACVRS